MILPVWKRVGEMEKNDAITEEQVKILYQQSPLLFISIVLLMFIALFYFWGKSDRVILLGWASAVAVLTVARVILVKRFHNAPSITDFVVWGRLFAASALISGMLWGFLPATIIDVTHANEVLLISIILTGMVAGSLVATSSYLPAYYLFSIPALAPLSFELLSQPEQEFGLIGFMVASFLLAMLGFSFQVNRNITDSIRLRFLNLGLLESFRQQKELAEKANIDKSRFLAATSHDLRQPLHALNLFLGAFHEKLDDHQQIEMLDKAMASSLSLSELLNALMDISHLDAGSIEVNDRHMDLATLTQSVVSEFDHQARERGIQIKTRLMEVLVRTDPVLLGRMIRNLLANAVSHNTDCTVTISMTREGGSVCLDIHDDGKGIAPSELENIFSEFYQLNNPERDRSKGLGLGLAIVKRLSKLMEIPVKVEGELGRGACFSLSIKIDDSDISRFERADVADAVDLTGIFILIIDDEAMIRDALKSQLRSWGCEVLLAESEQALLDELYREHYPRPDLIVSDYRLLDNKNGVEAVRAVRKLYQTDIPAIIVTGDSSRAIATATSAERCRLLLKPVHGYSLRSEIVGCLA